MEKFLGDLIRQARLRYGMSQAELARRIGLSKTAMNEIEKGSTRDPRFSVVEAIARTLGVSLEEFSRTTVAPPAPHTLASVADVCTLHN